MNFACIYAIVNTTNGKRYIGSAVCWRTRRTAHLRGLRAKRHHSVALQAAWDKYGEQSFTFAPLLICDRANLHLYEQRAIDAYGSAADGYNVAKVVCAGQLGLKRDAASLARMSEAQKLRWANYTPEQRAEIGSKHAARVWRDDSRKKIAKAHKGRVHTPEARKRMSEGRKNMKLTAEHKARISEGMRRSKAAAHTAAERSRVISYLSRWL